MRCLVRKLDQYLELADFKRKSASKEKNSQHILLLKDACMRMRASVIAISAEIGESSPVCANKITVLRLIWFINHGWVASEYT